MSFHQYALDNGHILGDLTAPTTDLLDISTPPVNLGECVLISKDGSTAFVSSKKNKSNQFVGDVFIYSFNLSTYNWDYVTNIYSIANTELSSHQANSAYVSEFGSSLCCNSDGSILAVGAPEFRQSNTFKGAVFIYEKTSSGWVYRQGILFSTANNYKLGYSLCGDDSLDKLFIGSDATSTLTDVYLYEKDTSSNSLNYSLNSNFNIKTLANFNSGTNATFGTSLDCSSDGNTLIVGSDNYQQDIDGNTRYPGEVHVFVNENGTWSLNQSLFSDVMTNKPSSLTLSNGSKLGNKVSVSADGSKLAIGTEVGYVFYYEYDTNASEYSFVKTYNSQYVNTNYGRDFVISKDGNYFLIGQNDENVFIHKYDSSNVNNPWDLDTNTNIKNLTSNGNSNFNGHYNDRFGSSIAISGDATRMLLGIPGFKSDGTKISGQAMFIFGKRLTTLGMSNIVDSKQSVISLNPVTNSDVSPVYSSFTSGQSIFTLNNASPPTLTITGVGTAQLQVSVTGSLTFTDKTIVVNVTGTKGSQIINYQAAIETTGSMTLGSTSGISFSASSGLTINVSYDNTFLSFDPTTNLFTSLAEGITEVTLSQAGNNQYYAATDVTIQYNIGDMQIYTVISNDSVKFFKDGVPYAQMLPTIVDGESTMGFVDNNGNAIDIANLEEDNPEIEFTENDIRIKNNGVYSLYMSSASNFDIVSKHGDGLQLISLEEYSKGFTGYINISLEEEKTLNFSGKNNPNNIHWVSSNSDVYEPGDYTFRYFAFDNATMLIWNLESLSIEGTGYTPRDDTVKSFSYTGDLQELTLPPGVNTCTLFMWGAGGSTGIGGYTESTVTLPSAGMTLYISVGKAGNSEIGGGASFVYILDDSGEYKEILVAGGGGVESGGGLISAGDTPSTQLTGLKETGIYNGLGAANGSGGGYYSGTNGAGGSGFVGSNVIIESFGVSKTTHGTDRETRKDIVPRFDHHTGVMYKNTCCFTPDSAFSDYYHNEQGGDTGKEQNDGFVYAAYADQPDEIGVVALQYVPGTITATLDGSATSWRYFVFDENILIKTDVVTGLVAVFTPQYNSNFTIFGHAVDSELNVIGQMRSAKSSLVTKDSESKVKSMNRRIQVSDAGGFSNVRSLENTENFLVTVTRDSSTFGISTQKFPLSVYLTYNGDIGIDSVALDGNGDPLTQVFTSSLSFTGGSEHL